MKRSARFYNVMMLLAFSVTAGCVAVLPRQDEIVVDDIPPGQAAVYAALPFPSPTGRSLELQAGDLPPVYLRGETISLFFVPEGQYTLELPEIPQQRENRRLIYFLNAGETYRMTILQRDEDGITEYAMVPATTDAYLQLLHESNLPVIQINGE